MNGEMENSSARASDVPLHVLEAAFAQGEGGEAPEELAVLAAPREAGLFEQLQEVLAGYRVLVVRGPQGVAITVIVAMAASLLLHVVAVGGLVGLAYIGWKLAPSTATEWAPQGEAGGSGGVLVEGLPGFNPTLGTVRLPTDAAAVVAPTLPEKPMGRAESTALLAESPNVIGLPTSSAPLGVPRVRLPAPPVVNEKIGSDVVASAAGKGGVSGAGVGSGKTGIGGGGEGTDAGEVEFDLLKPGKGGSGNGRGKGVGDGNDYGPSAANSRARIIDSPMGQTPMHIAVAKIPNDKVMFEVTIGTDGAVLDVKIKESSGNSEVDDHYRMVVRRWRYHPEYVAGRPIVSKLEPTITFRDAKK